MFLSYLKWTAMKEELRDEGSHSSHFKTSQNQFITLSFTLPDPTLCNLCLYFDVDANFKPNILIHCSRTVTVNFGIENNIAQ